MEGFHKDSHIYCMNNTMLGQEIKFNACYMCTRQLWSTNYALEFLITVMDHPDCNISG